MRESHRSEILGDTETGSGSLLVCESVEVTGAGAGVGWRRLGVSSIAGAGQAGRPAGHHCVGTVGQSLQPWLLGSLLRSNSRLTSPLLQSGLLVPLLVEVPAHSAVRERDKQENPVLIQTLRPCYYYLNRMLVFSVTMTWSAGISLTGM